LEIPRDSPPRCCPSPLLSASHFVNLSAFSCLGLSPHFTGVEAAEPRCSVLE
jgi:hypothetical protein